MTKAAGGGDFSLAIKDGGAFAWGTNSQGQLGDGTTTQRNAPVAVATLDSGVIAISAGTSHSLAVKDGNVYAWGFNSQGRLGDGTVTRRLTPTLVLDLAVDLIDVTAGNDASYALSIDGSLWVWGNNSFGQLGLGDLVERRTPTHLLPPDGFRYTSVEAGTGFVLATLNVVPEPAVGFAGCILVPILGRRRR